MQKLINAVQNYAWGSHTALTELYGIANPDNLPMAELWMGAHPKSSSQILAADGQPRSLREVIDADKAALLGDKVAARFGELPFLFKVLCADQPLSIQVHPNKKASEIGFAKENAAGIPLDAAERNYKDPNHKPELVFALTPFLAMNAFREFSEIVSLLQPVAGAHKAIAHFLENPNADALSQLFASLLNMQGEEKSHALAVLKAALGSQQGEPWETILLISEFYPDDSGLFSPLLLNVVKLNPGEAMFLFAETPHAYLQGVALEVMANSDNVLTNSGAIGTVGSAKMLMFPNAWAALFDLNGGGGGPVVTSTSGGRGGPGGGGGGASSSGDFGANGGIFGGGGGGRMIGGNGGQCAGGGGGGATINITVNGAVDPAGVGRQIVGYLKNYQRATQGRVLDIRTR